MVEGMSVVVNVMLYLMSVMSPPPGTKRIQLARGWCATVLGVCANCAHLSRLSGGPATKFFFGGSQPCFGVACSLRETLLDISRDSGASARQVEGTSGRAALNYWVEGPLHSSSRFPTSAGAVHKSVTLSSVSLLVQLTKCVVVCGSDLQRGHSGDGCLSLVILFKYESSRGHLFVLSWAMVRRVAL